MALKFLYKFRPDQLDKILPRPEDYTTTQIERAILISCARGYNQTAKGLRRFCERIGLLTAFDSFTKQVADEVAKGTLEDEKAVKGYFAQGFDNLLAKAYFEGGRQRNHLDSFFLNTFRTFENDSYFRRRCPVAEERTNAFFDAFAAFCAKLRQPGFVFSRGARALFKEMFRLQCASQTRSALTGKNQRNNQYLEFIFQDLPPEAREKLTQPPTMLDGYDLELLERFDAKCLDLIYKVKIMGFKYAEIAGEFERTADQLRRDFLNCKHKFRQAFSNWAE